MIRLVQFSNKEFSAFVGECVFHLMLFLLSVVVFWLCVPFVFCPGCLCCVFFLFVFCLLLCCVCVLLLFLCLSVLLFAGFLLFLLSTGRPVLVMGGVRENLLLGCGGGSWGVL